MKANCTDAMPTQELDAVTQQNVLINNCFFLWLHALVLLLSAIPVVSQIAGTLFNVPVWTVPKTYELKMYAGAMLACLALPFLKNLLPSLLSRVHQKYRLFSILFYPVAILLYSSPLPEFVRYCSVFIMALIGVGVLVYDMCGASVDRHSYLARHYNGLLITAIAFSTVVIVGKSDGNVFNLFSALTFATFATIFLILRYANYQSKYAIFLVPLLLYIVTYGAMLGAIEVSHYSFFLGPVIEILYGHSHPLSLDIQYGGGLTAFLAVYFKARELVSFAGLQELLKFLTFVQYLLIYFIASSLYRSSKIAFLTLLAILCFNFFGPNINYYYCAPSSGFLRFGLIYFILMCYVLEGKYISAQSTMWAVSIIGSIAFWWSFESAVYTLPALLFAEYIANNLRRFIPVFFVCFCATSLLYLSPFLLQGEWPPLWRYYEYAMVYANGFAQIPLNRLTSFWWLFPLLYGYFLLKIVTGSISNKLISVLTVYGMALFTYFGGRSHPIGIYVVSIPFILLVIYLVVNLKSISPLIKQGMLAFVLMVFPSAYYVIDGQRIISQGVWEVNLPLISNFLHAGSTPSFLISDSGAPWLNTTSNIIAVTNCGIYSPINKFIENNSIAIISEDDKNTINFHACTRSHNALQLNPYIETVMNPRASARMLAGLHNLANHYILVEINLINSKDELWGGKTTLAILQRLHAKKVGELTFGDEVMGIYHVKH